MLCAADTKKMPLGKLSRVQIAKGFEVRIARQLSQRNVQIDFTFHLTVAIDCFITTSCDKTLVD